MGFGQVRVDRRPQVPAFDSKAVEADVGVMLSSGETRDSNALKSLMAPAYVNGRVLSTDRKKGDVSARGPRGRIPLRAGTI